jgi:predicted ATPase
MKAHYISHIHIANLWGGDKPIAFDLHEDVNIIIGPNASGKTTIIYLLMFTLTGNVAKLIDYQFDYIKVILKAFDSGKELVVKVTKTKDEIRFEIAGKVFPFPQIAEMLRMRHGHFSNMPPEMLRRHFGSELFQLKRQLEGLVPAAWLPVSRRLPISEDEDENERRRLRRGTLESVDECLAELLEGLQRYRLSLDAQLAELRKDFPKHALENILYDKRHDRMIDLRSFKAPTQAEKQQLIKAFQDVGFDDTAMQLRVEEHFIAAQEAIEQLKNEPNTITTQSVFIIPLIHRTKLMVEFAQDLETKRQTLFAPLLLFESTICSFIENNTITVTPRGELSIKNDVNALKGIEWRHLSSGEKQLLILLIQALLWEKDPVVYVADEPELSLHVTWQEKLLKSITALAGQCQVIVATHSPDIAGGFPKRIIDLARI